jgi:hypothetical protein
MKKILSWVAVITMLVGVAAFAKYLSLAPINQAPQGVFESAPITSWTRTSQVTVTGTPVLLAATNTGRIYLIVTNASTTGAGAFLNFSTISTGTFSGFIGNNGDDFVINSNNPYVGPIYASSTAAGTTLTVLEK